MVNISDYACPNPEPACTELVEVRCTELVEGSKESCKVTGLKNVSSTVTFGSS